MTSQERARGRHSRSAAARQERRAPRAPRLVAAATLALLLAVSAAQEAQTLPAVNRSGVIYVDALALARALGVVATPQAGSLTWRGALGAITLFEDSPELLTPGAGGTRELSLSAPVLREDGDWLLPLDALSVLGAGSPHPLPRPVSVQLPSGEELPFAYREPPPPSQRFASGPVLAESAGEPLSGVRFYAENGVSLLLLDLALLPLADPSLTREVDLALANVAAGADDRLLLLILTAVAESEWDARLQFEQGGCNLEVTPPHRLQVLSGSESVVNESEPVIAALLLPPTFSPYSPMRVRWAGAEAEVLFRK